MDQAFSAPEVTFRIGQVAEILGVEPHVLRYWEKEFHVLKPRKDRRGQRIYTEEDVRIALLIRHLLYEEGYTIEGARRKLHRWITEGDIPAEVRAQLQTEYILDRLRHIKSKLNQILKLLDRSAHPD